ncbi:MAG TPA: amino acid permease [Vicinamibacterales bacterium]|nr:amino acid permease [Vicinamibacterales bacterium]
MRASAGNETPRPRLARELGLLGLTATGVCAMVGAGINIIPFMIQRNVPGIGPFVLPAFAIATLPVLLAGLAYAVLASAMPRAGGTYVYASRGLSPYLGFVASFSQWFALCVAIGVVSYVIVPFLRDIAVAASWPGLASALERGPVRLTISLTVLWAAVGVNVRGVALYERLVVPLMFLTFLLGGIVIVAGFMFDHGDFAAALAARGDGGIPDTVAPPVRVGTMLTASAVLFASFIGFDSIAQAGGEAKNPGRNLPLAIAFAVGSVAVFYMLFTAAVYHAVPWQYIAAEAQVRDLTAPGLLGYLLPPFWTVLIVSAAAIALIKDLPPMLLSVSRLMFAWAEDGIFPKAVAAVHPAFRTPHVAILASGGMATLGVVGSHLAGDFFLGVDILVTAMLVNFLLMAVTVLTLPTRNPMLTRAVTVLPSAGLRAALAALGVIVLSVFLAMHTWKDLTGPAVAWYFRSTYLWAVVLAAGSAIYWREVRALGRRGVDLRERFAQLPVD